MLLRIVTTAFILLVCGTSLGQPPQVDAAAVFDELVVTIRTCHSYATLRNPDLDALATEARQRIGEPAAYRDTIIEMQRLVCHLGDGHAGVEEFQDVLPMGYLPVLLASAEGGVVAIKPDRSALLDSERPFVVSIDQVPLSQWLDAVKPFVPAGSPQMVNDRSLRLLRWINFARQQLQRPSQDVVWIEVADASGDDRASYRLPLADRRPIYGDWPRTESRLIEPGIGYLRIESMDLNARDLRRIDEMIHAFARNQELKGIVIDVRGNSGGSRDALHRLLPLFMPPDHQNACRVVNAAKYRLQPDDDLNQPDGYLANRELYPLTWQGWTDAERLAIQQFVKSFNPSWAPPQVGFSDWHYSVVSRARHHQTDVFLNVPVVLLIDSGCFSATDVFVAAFDESPNVTLLGTSTSGGSARSQRHRMKSIDATLRLGTMVSYRPNGLLYDGLGIEPDELVLPNAEYYINEGRDQQLERALQILNAPRDSQ